MICGCGLAGTKACLSCQRNLEQRGSDWSIPSTIQNWSINPLPQQQIPLPNLKVKRVIEKFDDKGNLIERITEE
jgi:hypothetical protein